MRIAALEQLQPFMADTLARRAGDDSTLDLTIDLYLYLSHFAHAEHQDQYLLVLLRKLTRQARSIALPDYWVQPPPSNAWIAWEQEHTIGLTVRAG